MNEKPAKEAGGGPLKNGALITTSDLVKQYPVGRGHFTALADIDLTIERHQVGQRMFKNMATMAPAMGMIGTLVGLVQMLANMSDPAAIGPAMAVALLTTLYGAVIEKTVRVPSYMVEIISKLKTAQVELETRLDRTPTVHELADHMGFGPDKLKLVKRAMRAALNSGDAVSIGDMLSSLGMSLQESRPSHPPKPPDSRAS